MKSRWLSAIKTVLVLVLILLLLPVPRSTAAPADPTYVWAKRMGAGSWDHARGATLDGAGNVYTTGYFGGMVDFDPGAGTYNLSSAGGADVFVSKLDTDGNFVWARAMGGTGTDLGYDVVLDGVGNVYIIGTFSGTADFNPGTGSYNLTSAGSDDIFICKLTSSGNLVWAIRMGGTGQDYGVSLRVDDVGNLYATGFFNGTADFDPGAGTLNLISQGGRDVFVVKLDNNGSLIWAKSFGGTADDQGMGVVVDGNGNVYSVGGFHNTVDFDPGAGIFNLTSAGDYDAFISKLDSGGNFVWAKALSGTDQLLAKAIILDTSGNVYTTGHFYGTADFDPGTGTYNLTSAGGSDIFVGELDSNGNLVWMGAMGGTGQDTSSAITMDGGGNIYTTGDFSSTADFDPGTSTYNLTSAGNYDIFISRLNGDGRFAWAVAMGGTANDIGFSVDVDNAGNIYTSGYFIGVADFDPGTGTQNLNGAGGFDIFVSKLAQSDVTPPIVVATNITSPYTTGPTSFTVTYSEDVYDPAGNTDPDDVTNPANYLLVEAGPNGDFDTLSCGSGVQPDDVQIPIDTITYNNAIFTATINFNGGVPLPDGTYRLFVCGTTSIMDPETNLLNGGADSLYNFTVQALAAAALPATGFPQGRVTALPPQPESKAYTTTDLSLEIPKLGLSLPIVGVPLSNNGWDVSWLGNSAGWLQGSAFPTWPGNTVLTAHVWDAFNNPGPFVDLKTLRYGDRVEIHAWGQVYVYEVRQSFLLWGAKNTDRIFQHEEYDVLTLLT
ncbi:sortase, partial [Candidatus Parcubacteria bacterium]